MSRYSLPLISVGEASGREGCDSRMVYVENADLLLRQEGILYETSLWALSKEQCVATGAEWQLKCEAVDHTSDPSTALVRVSTRGDERFGYGFWSVLAGDPLCIISGSGVSGKRILTVSHRHGVAEVSLGKWHEGLFVLSYKDQLTVFPQSVDGSAFLLRIINPTKGIECSRLSENVSKLVRFNAPRKPAS